MIRLLQHPAALIVLCFALAGTPVSYRGGASDAHPHMFLEFLIDATTGAFDHHHHGDAPAETIGSTEAHAHAGDRDSESSGTDPSLAQTAVDGTDRFAPTISAFVVGDVGQLASILPQHDLGPASELATLFQPFGTMPAGLSHAPIAPPPR